jgi:deoxycytidylate deaminase
MTISALDLHFLQMASLVAQSDPESIRTHAELNVHRHARGSVIAKGNKVMGQGRSTHLGGDLDNPNVSERFVASLNAEITAMSDFLQKHNSNFQGCTMYSTTCPNWLTFKTVMSLGIKRFVHYGPTSDPKINYYSQKLGIQVISAA